MDMVDMYMVDMDMDMVFRSIFKGSPVKSKSEYLTFAQYTWSSLS